VPPHGAPRFSQVPHLGQQAAQKEQAEKQAQAGVMQTVQQLSLKIYSDLALRQSWPLDDKAVEELQQLARDSQVAARAYFEGLGIAQFGEPTPPKQDAQ
jgi:hypothetical protein